MNVYDFTVQKRDGEVIARFEPTEDWDKVVAAVEAAL